jgi:hypothetical protein
MRRSPVRHHGGRSPLTFRYLLLLGALALVGATLLLAAPADAHDGHEPLPEGFRAEITRVVDASGAEVSLEGVTFAVAPGGIGATVTNSGERLLEVVGEQGGEPLLRVTATEAAVNETSPQAADVEGAVVDPAAVASLQDLAWGRVPPVWVPLSAGGTVTWIDHRAAPGHPPARADFSTGDVAAEFQMGFLYDGESYQALGQVVAVPGGDAGVPWLPIGAGALVLIAVGVAVLNRRRSGPPEGGKAHVDGDVEKDVAVPAL